MEMALRHFCELNPKFVPSEDWHSNYFENIHAHAGCSLCWIVADEDHAGFILYGVEPHRFLNRVTGAIYELYVRPEYRRKGVARESAQLAISELRKAAPSKIQLEVMEGNEAALRLWKSLGFHTVSQRLTLVPE